MPQPRRKVKIVSPILIEGKHAEPGDVFDLPMHTAQELLGAGTAVAHLEPGEKAPPDATTVNRMAQAENADPPASKISSGKPKATTVKTDPTTDTGRANQGKTDPRSDPRVQGDRVQGDRVQGDRVQGDHEKD